MLTYYTVCNIYLINWLGGWNIIAKKDGGENEFIWSSYNNVIIV